MSLTTGPSCSDATVRGLRHKYDERGLARAVSHTADLSMNETYSGLRVSGDVDAWAARRQISC